MINSFRYLYWQFIDIPKRIIKIFSNLIWFGYYFFSIRYCLKNLFSPWKKIVWKYDRGLNIGQHIETFFSNIISRVIGFLMKVFILIIFIVYEVIIILLGIISFIGWISIPFVVLFLLFFGLKYV